MPKQYTTLDLIIKLTGPIEPMGCSNRDAIRLENIKELGNIAAEITQDISYVLRFSDRHESSIIQIVKAAQAALEEIVEHTPAIDRIGKTGKRSEVNT